jgi:hypothetical protein
VNSENEANDKEHGNGAEVCAEWDQCGGLFKRRKFVTGVKQDDKCGEGKDEDAGFVGEKSGRSAEEGSDEGERAAMVEVAEGGNEA